MSWKRFVVVLCALGFVMGCGGGGESAPTPPAPAEPSAKPAEAPSKPANAPAAAPAQVTLWHSYRADEQKAIDHVIRDFNRRGGVQVQVVAVPYDAFVDKINVTVPRGKGPDLFIFAHNMIGAWSRLQLIEPLSQKVDRAVLERFFPETVKALVFQKTLYGLPLAFKSVALFYNKALVSEPPATFDALIASARQHKEAAAGRYGLAYEAAKLYFHAPFLYGFGGQLFDESGAVRIHTPEAVEAIAFARRLAVDEGLVPKAATSFLISSLFNEGKAAYVINGSWFRGEIDPKVDYGVAPLPTLPGDRAARPFLGSEAVFINAQGKNKDAALEVALWLSSNPSARIRARTGKQSVANRVVYEGGGANASPWVKTFLSQLQSGQLMPATAAMQAVWASYDMALQKAIFGDTPADQALADAEAKIRADIEKLKR